MVDLRRKPQIIIINSVRIPITSEDTVLRRISDGSLRPNMGTLI